MPQKVYLDDSGEPVAAPKVYLDDHGNPIPAAASASAERGGLRHPLTSMVAPEIESARSALNAATDSPHGQPIMARSRMGTLYPSETGTGAVNAAKAAARGAGGAVLDQVEGLTSPLGLATAGAAKGTSTLMNSPSARATTGKVMQFIGDDLIDLRKPLKVVAKAGKWLQGTAEEAPELPTPPTGPHLDRSVPMRPSEMTQQQIMERVKFGQGTPKPVSRGVNGRELKAPTEGRLQIAPTDRPPITVSPESPMQPPDVKGELAGVSTNSVHRIDPDAQIQYSRNNDGIAIQSGKGATAENFGRSHVEQQLIATPGIHKQFPASGVDPSGKWFILAKDGDAFNRLVDELPDAVSARTASPLLQPRVDIGAEKVGRMNGLSKIDVRNQTGPIRGEAPGEAAGMPAKPRERILDKLIDMGPKGRGLPESEREAYAAAGTSDKTRLQVQAMLDALRKVGFVGAAAAAPSLMRNKLVSGIEEQ